LSQGATALQDIFCLESLANFGVEHDVRILWVS
jgi:hypothetical protein